MQKVRDIIQGIPDFNIREKARLYVVIKKTAKLIYIQNGNLANGQIKNYSVGFNKVQEHRNSRERKLDVIQGLRQSRASQGVFYLSSSHSNPAKDHADYQGRIYVDRFWRSVLAADDEKRRAVEAYIRNHDTMTVQEVIREPVYFITRPYCKHFFIPLDTDEVLGSSLNKVKKSHPEAHVRNHNLDYRRKYYMERERIHTVLKMESEAEVDRKLIRKSR